MNSSYATTLEHVSDIPGSLRGAANIPEQEDLPVRSARRHARCLNGHDLEQAGVNGGYHHDLRTSTWTCNLCRELHLPRARWLVIEHGQPTPAEHAAERARVWPVLLVARRPEARAGIGRLELRVRDAAIADVDLQLCGVDHRGVVRRIRVDVAYLRRGFGTVMLDAAMARGPGYHWSTVELDPSPQARAFWATQAPIEQLHLGEPHYCSHMREANGDWF